MWRREYLKPHTSGKTVDKLKQHATRLYTSSAFLTP
jgi:hypothetical protein